MSEPDRGKRRLQKAPQFVEIDITAQCNQRCAYCSHFGSASDTGPDLPKEEWTALFQELSRSSVLSVTIGGGEPFIRNDIIEILEEVIRNKMRFDIGTNGTLITDEMARFLASTKRCNFVQVSIDGSNAEMHDIMRGAGSFDRALKGFERLRSHGVQVAVRVTIHKHNVHHLDEIAKFFLDDLELPSISLCDVFGIGYGRDASGQTRLDTDLLSYAMERMLWLSEEKYPNRIFSPSHGPLGRTDGWCELEFARERSALSSTPDHLRSCGAAKMAIAVRADGVYVPCGQLSHIELGRINQDSLQDIWWNHPELERLRARYEISLGNFDFCKGCDYISGCPGGCPGTAYELAGSDEHPSPDVCLRRFLHDGGRLPEKRMASLRSTYTTPVSDQLSGNEVANG